jgi:hypothetical protein
MGIAAFIAGFAVGFLANAALARRRNREPDYDPY